MPVKHKIIIFRSLKPVPRCWSAWKSYNGSEGIASYGISVPSLHSLGSPALLCASGSATLPSAPLPSLVHVANLSLNFPVVKIRTDFNPSASVNKLNPCNSDRARNLRWTENQRREAMKGVMVSSASHLETEVRVCEPRSTSQHSDSCHQLHSFYNEEGYKRNENSYIQVPMNAFYG